MSDRAEALEVACLALVRAYSNAEETGQVEWSDLDDAHELAQAALAQLVEAARVQLDSEGSLTRRSKREHNQD